MSLNFTIVGSMYLSFLTTKLNFFIQIMEYTENNKNYLYFDFTAIER